MKKLLTIVLILLLSCGVSLAEMDVKGMTDDELKQAYREVMTELMERKIWEESTLPAGVYIGGINLPEGTYALTLKESGIVEAWPSFEAFKAKNSDSDAILYEYHKKGAEISMILTDGLCWVIPSDAIAHPFVGLDW